MYTYKKSLGLGLILAVVIFVAIMAISSFGGSDDALDTTPAVVAKVAS